jgi:hypothetical protein
MRFSEKKIRNKPRFDEPLSYLILHVLLDVGTFSLPDFLFDIDQSVLILSLVLGLNQHTFFL